jgi:hypothetical protein
MSSLLPRNSANRLLAIDQPLLHAPPHSPNNGYAAAESHSPRQFNQNNQDARDRIITSIYELLNNLRERAAISEANQEAQSNAFATIHQKLVELDHRWDVVIDRDNPDCLGAVFDPLFDLGPAIAENQNVLLDKMNAFHSAMMRQQGKLINKVERMESNQLQITKDVMEQLELIHGFQVDGHEHAKGKLDNMNDAQSHIMERLKRVHKANLEQHETLREKLEDFDDEHKDLEIISMERLDKIDNDLEKQEISLMEKINFMDKNQSDLESSLMESLDKIDTTLEDQKINLMEKMNYINVEQSELEKKVMRMLNKLQGQQKKAETSHSQWSVLVYASQDRIIDRLEVLEKKIRQMLEKIPNVSEAGDNSEERILTRDSGDIAQFGPEHDAEVFVAPTDLPIDQPAELDVGGNLKALWEVLAPLLVVSMFLSLW